MDDLMILQVLFVIIQMCNAQGSLTDMLAEIKNTGVVAICASSFKITINYFLDTFIQNSFFE